MMRKYIAIAILIISVQAHGQDLPSTFSYNRTEVTLAYMPAVPLGKTGDFIQRVSPRGVDFEVTKYINEGLSAGFILGWTTFAEKVTGETLDYNQLTISGTQFRYLNTMPILLNVRKYFMEDEMKPYVGLGLGTTWNEWATDIGIIQLTDRKWLFALSPEIGINYSYGRGSSVLLKVKYHYSFKAQEFDPVSYLSFGLGFSIN
jgi:outer membrane protein